MSIPESNPTTTLRLRPLDAPLGAEVLEVDLTTVGDAVFAQIYESFLRHKVLVFRNQELSPAAQVGFARRFGEVQVHVLNQYHLTEYPELYFLSNLDEHGRPSGEHPDPGTVFWHTDGSWTKRTTIATMMYSIEVPSEGGQTHFADMAGAYQGLDPLEQSRLDQLYATHNLDFSRKRRQGESPLTEEQRLQVPPVVHPVVRTHPKTGCRCLYLGDHAESIVGMAYASGRALIDDLNLRAIRPELVYDHNWQPRELVVWDNCSVLHRASPYDTARERRVMRRATVLGPA